MKGYPLLLAAVTFLAVNSNAYSADESLKAGTEGRDLGAAPVPTQLKPNQIKIGNLTCIFILIQALKTDNALQLLNPYATAKYGSADDNTVLDPYKKTAIGLKFFAIEF